MCCGSLGVGRCGGVREKGCCNGIRVYFKMRWEPTDFRGCKFKARGSPFPPWLRKLWPLDEHFKDTQDFTQRSILPMQAMMRSEKQILAY